MKKILFVRKSAFVALVLLSMSNISFGQSIQTEKYEKVMSFTFADDFTDKEVVIEGEFLKNGFIKNMKKPGKLKKMYFFQCLSIGGQSGAAPVTNEACGDFFVIDKSKADVVMELKKGDKLRIKGTPYYRKYYGIATEVYFIVESIEII